MMYVVTYEMLSLQKVINAVQANVCNRCLRFILTYWVAAFACVILLTDFTLSNSEQFYLSTRDILGTWGVNGIRVSNILCTLFTVSI